ncbi:hypothetical protein [Pontibacter brevis]
MKGQISRNKTGLEEPGDVKGKPLLHLQFLHEYPYSPYSCFRHKVQGKDGYWRIWHWKTRHRCSVPLK